MTNTADNRVRAVKLWRAIHDCQGEHNPNVAIIDLIASEIQAVRREAFAEAKLITDKQISLVPEDTAVGKAYRKALRIVGWEFAALATLPTAQSIEEKEYKYSTKLTNEIGEDVMGNQKPTEKTDTNAMKGMTLQEMSDYLAEHLLGWQRGRDPNYPHPSNEEQWWAGDVGAEKSQDMMGIWSWRPHSDIQQCFDYIVPAMRAEGYNLEMNAYSNGKTWTNFYMLASDDAIYNSHSSYLDELDATIVEAAYKAIKRSRPMNYKIDNPELARIKFNEMHNELLALRKEVERLRKIEDAARNLEDKMSIVFESDKYKAVWSLWYSHFGNYAGQTIIDERENLVAALTQSKGE